MIKTSNILNGILRKLFFVVCVILFALNAIGQTVYTFPDFINDNTDAAIPYNEIESLSNCTSIDVVFEFNSSFATSLMVPSPPTATIVQSLLA